MEKVIKFWLASAKENLKIAKDLNKTGRYSFAMFMCQQTLEALFKALIIKKTKEHPPYIHNLGILARPLKLKIPKEILIKLKEVDKHYIKARYKEDRFNLKIYNKENASNLIKNTQEVAKWFTKKMNLKI